MLLLINFSTVMKSNFHGLKLYINWENDSPEQLKITYNPTNSSESRLQKDVKHFFSDLRKKLCLTFVFF